MKWNSLLLIGTVLCASTLTARAQTAVESSTVPALETAANSKLAQIPHATNEEKKAIMASIELATIEGAKFGFLNQKLIFQNQGEFIKKLLDLQQVITDRILSSDLKDKLPAFYKEYLVKSKELCKETAAKLSTIDDITHSPELKELEKKNKAATAIYDDYLKREMGFDMTAYANNEGKKLAMIAVSILQNPDAHPSVAELKKGIEPSASQEQKEELEQKLIEEVFKIATEQYRQNKQKEEASPASKQ